MYLLNYYHAFKNGQTLCPSIKLYLKKYKKNLFFSMDQPNKMKLQCKVYSWALGLLQLVLVFIVIIILL